MVVDGLVSYGFVYLNFLLMLYSNGKCLTTNGFDGGERVSSFSVHPSISGFYWRSNSQSQLVSYYVSEPKHFCELDYFMWKQRFKCKFRFIELSAMLFIFSFVQILTVSIVIDLAYPLWLFRIFIIVSTPKTILIWFIVVWCT